MPDLPPSSRLHAIAREWAFAAALVACTLVARGSLADHYHVPSGSMLPTLQLDDRVFVDKAAYGVRVPLTQRYVVRFDGPRRGDVVVLDSPLDGAVLIKRVVALPGDEVRVRGGHLHVGGEPAPISGPSGRLVEVLDDRPHRVRLRRGGGPDFGPVRLPTDRYLVLGDNRGDSADGRVFGLVERDAILGRAVAVYYRRGFVWERL